jgi:hypothetical protein
MFNTKTLLSLLSAACLLGFAPLASADTISTIPSYDGTASFGPFPTPISIGTFSFSIPTGETIYHGTISGTFGNNDVPGTTTDSAPADLFIAGETIEVAECDDALSYSAPCDAGASPTAWSYSFTQSDIEDLSSYFASGSIDLSAEQNGVFAVNLGTVTLDLSSTPEPNSLWLLGTGLLCLLLCQRLRIQKNA